jgi:hypothetical protein
MNGCSGQFHGDFGFGLDGASVANESSVSERGRARRQNVDDFDLVFGFEVAARAGHTSTINRIACRSISYTRPTHLNEDDVHK